MNTNYTSRLHEVALTLCILGVLLSMPVFSGAEELIGEGPRLGPFESRVTQDQVESKTLTLQELRKAGLKLFTTPFNKYDGFGDGPINPSDPTSPGGRPTLQNNNTYLRVNGLDSQTCLECHGIVSTATIPMTQGIGGFSGINSAPMFQPRFIDVEDYAGNGFAGFDGRLIIPPHLFGVGGVQLVAKEMTGELQRLKEQALANPGVPVNLKTKNVNFGTVVADMYGNLDTSGVEGIDDDLVVRPFGRKGEFSSVRQFDLGAMLFHFGMQPVEVVGEGVDGDGDGVVNEVLMGEVSVLEIFLTTQDRPFREPLGRDGRRGFRIFMKIGCADCHHPLKRTDTPFLTYSFPEIETEPFANAYQTVDLADAPSGFVRTNGRGIKVEMFSDLKRHDMGPGLAEDFYNADERENREFITAKLWGVADTAPYLHDGRAQTLNEAILLHGGEALAARNSYVNLTIMNKNRLLGFLLKLRTPKLPNKDVQDDGGRITK
jgi:hypothetical protein